MAPPLEIRKLLLWSGLKSGRASNRAISRGAGKPTPFGRGEGWGGERWRFSRGRGGGSEGAKETTLTPRSVLLVHLLPVIQLRQCDI